MSDRAPDVDTPRDRPAPEVRGAGWLPHPVMSLLVASAWLLLQESLAPAHLLVGAALGVALPRLLHGFLGPGSRVRRLRTALRLVAVVLWDIVRANLTVARIVLWPGSRPRPAWVIVDLDVRHPTALALLATVVTNTPGTVSSVVDEERHVLLVHALDAHDPLALALEIKQRYERPLMEVFE